MKCCIIFLLFIISVISFSKSEKIYKVIAQRFSNNSIINRNNSDWDWNYNAALFSYFNPHSGQTNLGLVVRLQNSVNKSDPYAPGPSYMATSYITFDNDGLPVASAIRNSTWNTTCKQGFLFNMYRAFHAIRKAYHQWCSDKRLTLHCVHEKY
jgi:hypothetical protein